MAGMFNGAIGVNITGGSFKTINGAYHHTEYVTHQHNVHSNNVVGNTYEDVYEDHSQTHYGTRRPTRSARNRQNTANGGERPGQYRHESEPYPPAIDRSLPPRSYTTPVTRSLGLVPLDLSSMTQVGQGTYVDLKEGDVQKMNQESAGHLKSFFSSMGFSPLRSQRQGVEEFDELEDTEGETDSEEGMSGDMRWQSPPITRMAQMSIDDPSIYEHQSQAQTPYDPPYTPPLPHSAPRTTFSPRPQRPSKPVFQQTQAQPHYPSFMPGMANSNTSRQATENHMNHVKNTLIGAGNMNPTGQAFIHAPRSSYSTTYDSTNPSDVRPIYVSSDTESEAESDSSFGAVGNPPGLAPREQVFHGHFTEFSHEVTTNNYGFSGIVANNVVRNVYSGRQRSEAEEPIDVDLDGEEEDTEEGEDQRKKRNGATGKQGRARRRRK
ncbi:hypothetical protein GALMADRAFT_214538 [Galerina marginata CBS 339.88]|uniref:Uncharacterized protein n=1 Tax=Galerina marginata (strain CBS 339.88) TaxID=685588 RepID=A0A067SHV8_GALM3|nr:hypothetical protein GALMADRAFT_214538 [Galerina marginata CBS 339.88]